MPLLPGESREKDTYTSGLAFIDSAARDLKVWANRAQVSIEKAWIDLTAPATDVAGARASAQDMVSRGPMVPTRLYLDEDVVIRILTRVVLTVIYAIEGA